MTRNDRLQTEAPDALRYSRAVSEAGLGGVFPFVLDWMRDDVDVLDVGCNTGYVGRALMERFRCRVDGVDLDDAAAREAAGHYRAATSADLESVSLHAVFPGPYDYVLMLDVLEHVREQAGVLSEVRRVLRPGGRLIVSVPNIAHWTVRRDLLRGRFEYADLGLLDRTHVRFFTRSTIQRALTDAGFRVEVCDQTWNTIPWKRLVPKRLRPAVVRRFPGALGYQFVVRAALPS